jgi:3-oxoisoapionate kinase
MVDVAFYGDDFTGSTDALRQFERCGLRSVLLVEFPPADELRKLASRYDVIGVAGIARSLAPDEQEAEIRPILTALRDLGPRVVQYKICSTADSSPRLGSLGRALEVGRSIFGTSVIPVLAAQPELGRYTVFSHHFAAEAGTVFRLDRQPTMTNHPATPMDESDLRVHLAKQTDLRIGSIHLSTYADLPAHYAQVTDADVLILDALTDEDLRTVGQAILAADNSPPVFAMGSGGLSRALARELSGGAPDKLDGPARRNEPGNFGGAQVLVVSGSQSKRTAEQIEHAVAAGWRPLELGDPAVRQKAVDAFRASTPGVVVHAGGGKRFASIDLLGERLAGVVREVLQRTEVRRVVVAGGDTSGRVLRELGVTALELTPGAERLGPGLALCTAIASDAYLDGVQLLLKGGQIGHPDLFDSART